MLRCAGAISMRAGEDTRTLRIWAKAIAPWSTSRSRRTLLCIRSSSKETDLGALGSAAPPVGWGHVPQARVPSEPEDEESPSASNLKVTRWLLPLPRSASAMDARCPAERCSKRFFNACGSGRRKKGQRLPTRQRLPSGGRLLCTRPYRTPASTDVESQLLASFLPCPTDPACATRPRRHVGSQLLASSLPCPTDPACATRPRRVC